MDKFLVFSFDIFAEIMFYLIFIRVILSWFAVKNRFQKFVSELTDPVLAIFSKFGKTKSGIDFSPILAMIVLEITKRLIHYATGIPLLRIF